MSGKGIGETAATVRNVYNSMVIRRIAPDDMRFRDNDHKTSCVTIIGQNGVVPRGPRARRGGARGSWITLRLKGLANKC